MVSSSSLPVLVQVSHTLYDGLFMLPYMTMKEMKFLSSVPIQNLCRESESRQRMCVNFLSLLTCITNQFFIITLWGSVLH
jgi:hypothetical protein